jgi:CheY-like chemotaxis protein
MKIMVVDDEPDVELMFRHPFRKELKTGLMEFHFALSAMAALDHLEHKDATDFLLILSDINMPGMNGLELLKIIKNRFSYLKVFMITAYGDEHNYRMSMEYGADDYLTKPLDFEKLKQKIFNL